MLELHKRYEAGLTIAQDGAKTALHHFTHRDTLNIESKGTQDWVSNADRDVEIQIREAIAALFPNDTIVGEEHDNTSGSSSYTWVIDPIDGTSSFVNSMPGWCVVLACLSEGKTVFGIVVDPIANEVFSACDGIELSEGSVALKVSEANSLSQGSVAVGHSTRFDHKQTLKFMNLFLAKGGIYYCNGSGALMLSYVACGRLLGYVEPHMYAWDCMAALYLIERGGGLVRPFEQQKMLERGTRVVAGAPGVFEVLLEMTDASYSSAS